MKSRLAALCFCTVSLLFSYSGHSAEPTEAERKTFQEIKAKAEKGDVQAQTDLGTMYDEGRGIGQDYAEAVRWYRKAAEQNYPEAQFRLGTQYFLGWGVARSEAEGLTWYYKAAAQNYAKAQVELGIRYEHGNRGVAKDEAEAMKWYRKAAEQNSAEAQCILGMRYWSGIRVPKDYAESAKWYRKSGEQNYAYAQKELGRMHEYGYGVVKNEIEAYKWYLLYRTQESESASVNSSIVDLERKMTPEQRAEGQRLAREWRPRKAPTPNASTGTEGIVESNPASKGTGFAITEDGYFITNQHVISEGATVRLRTTSGIVAAKVVKVDKANDLALLKAEGRYSALPVGSSREVRLGATVVTVGFPNIGLQGFSPKLAKGEIASLAGVQDDPRYFQISVPLQPGNSGGALMDERGNVVGVVAAKLSQKVALATTGTLAENVNYAVKSSYLLSFLESVPEVAAKLKRANLLSRKFEDVVKSVEQATVLVLVY